MHKNLLGIKIKNYQVVKFIGKGEFAHVYKAIDQNDKKFVAMKVMLKGQLMSVPKRRQLALSEIKILKECNNPNVIKYFESFENSDYLFIITEFCNGGDLANKLIQKRKIPEQQAITYLKQILNGFKGLRENNASHRDLKASNILLHDNVCKIADLGSSKQLNEDDQTKTLIGTVLTSAPQLLQGKPYGPLVDIWSIGALFYQMIYGRYPFDAKSDAQLVKVIHKNSIKFDKIKIGQHTKNFIQRCLTINPKQRMSWDQIFFHPLIGDMGGLTKKKNQIRNLASMETSATSTSSNRNSIQKQAKDVAAYMVQKLINQEKQKTFTTLEKLYLDKKNDMIFTDKFIHPQIKQFENKIRLNHSTLLFLLYKKSYFELLSMHQSMIAKKNIFNFQEYFEEYVQTENYKYTVAQVLDAVGKTKHSCEVSKSSMGISTLQIIDQLDLNKPKSENIQSLIKTSIDEYRRLLTDQLEHEPNQKMRNYMTEVICALKYYRNNPRPYSREYQKIVQKFDATQEQIALRRQNKH